MKSTSSPYLSRFHGSHSLLALAGMLLASPVVSAVDADGDGLPDDWELAHSSIFAAWPPVLNETLLPYTTAARSFLLNNATPAAVTYTATLSNHTVPIYKASDSITGGVAYAWDEISATGTLLTTISNTDDASEPVAITGFAFPFYGSTYSEVHVSSNGLLDFGFGNSSGYNVQIPGSGAPQNTIAAFWDDLDTRTTGTVYYRQEATRLIVQFQEVGRYGTGAGNYTFQVVLHATGKIELRYKTMTGILNSASIGIQGPDARQGVGIVADAAYVADSLALRLDTTSEFFRIPTLAGSVPAYTVGSLNGIFDSLSLPPGVYSADVSISHTGAGPSPLALTANLTVPDQPGAISITSPATGSTAMQGTSVLIQTTATDPDGLEKVEFYDGTTKLGETRAYPGNDYQNFYWYLSENGSRSITARAIDFFGGVTLSSPILFNATANNDFDGMPDSWEIANYLDPNDPNDGVIDADTDGYTNLEEYLFATDPQIAEDTDFDGMPDGWEFHNGTDIDVADSHLDTDNDGLTHLEEYWYATNPLTFDTDGDLLPDLYEIENYLDPRVHSGDDDADSDGLTNLDEFLNLTNPNNADSDGDSVTDADEVGQGSDPNNPADGGQPPADPLESVEFNVGGDYASWRMEIKALGPRDTRTLLVVSPAPNQWETKSHKLLKNNKYEITMHHTGSRPQDDPPWYCWEGQIDGLPGGASFEVLPEAQLGARSEGGKYFVVKNHWIVDNLDGLLTSHLHSEGVNHVPGKKATLLPVEIKEVSLAGAKYHELKKDNVNVTYSAPHWVDKDGNGDPTDTANGEKDYSVAYTRNTKPSIGAKFSVQDIPNNLAMKLRAKGSDGIEILETAAQINGNDVTLPVTASITTWPNTIKYYDRSDANKTFKLDWEIKVEDADWAQVASTNHQVYLILNDPATALRQETLFYLSAKNADGDNTEAAVRDSIYNEFTDRVVARLDGVQMTYWMNNAMGCTDTPDLLSRQDGNGNCQSWGGFFRDMLLVHGISADRIRVWPKAGDSSVIVKNWQFNQPPSGLPQHPYIEGLDAFDLAGIPGQGNLNPPGSFNGHWITKSGGHYYDPSYGTAAIKGGNVDKEYEDGAFDGFGAQYQDSTGAVLRGIRKNNDGNAAVSEVEYFLAN